MATIWKWGFRNPALAGVVLALGSGLAGVAEWSLATMSALVFVAVAESANHLAQRAEARARRSAWVLQAVASERVFRGRFKDNVEVRKAG